MAWTKKQKDRADEYVEIIFDDIQEKTENVALWFHANEEGDAAIYVTRSTPERRALLIESLTEAFLIDRELLEDVVTSVAIAVHRSNEDGESLSWDELLE